MKFTILLFSLLFCGVITTARAQDTDSSPGVRRLDYIHFDTVNQSIQWGVTEGSLDDNGDFVPSGTSTYSIDIKTGEMGRDGSDAPMSPAQADDATRVFHALAQLMQTYTDRFSRTGSNPEKADPQEGPSPEKANVNFRSISFHQNFMRCPIGLLTVAPLLSVERSCRANQGAQLSAALLSLRSAAGSGQNRTH